MALALAGCVMPRTYPEYAAAADLMPSERTPTGLIGLRIGGALGAVAGGIAGIAASDNLDEGVAFPLLGIGVGALAGGLIGFGYGSILERPTGDTPSSHDEGDHAAWHSVQAHSWWESSFSAHPLRSRTPR